MNTTKKIAACIAVLALLRQTACSISGQGANPTGATLEISFEHSYASEQILENETNYIWDMKPAGEWIVFTAADDKGNQWGEAYNTNSGEVQKLNRAGVPIGASEVNGNIQVFWSDVTYEEYEVVDAAYTLVTYDSSLNELSTEDVTQQFTIPDAAEGYRLWYKDTDGSDLIVDGYGALYWISPDGTQKKLDTDEIMFDNVFRSGDGKLYATGYGMQTVIGEVDTGAMTFRQLTVPDMPEWCNGILPGTGDYSFYYASNSGLIGVKPDLSSEEAVNWENSDFGQNITPEAVLPDGQIIINEFQFSTGATTYWKLHARPQEETDNVKLISMATMQNWGYLQDIVHAYNRQAQGHRIVVRSYVDENPDAYYNAKTEFEAMQNDMLAGKTPDILCLDDTAYAVLSNKNLFEDWYPWMENDPDFRKEDYFMNFFDAMSYKGRLERMAFSFTAQFMEAKTEFVGDNSALTIQDYIHLGENMPEGMTLFSQNQSREGALYALVLSHLDSFIDYENASCSFNTPEFMNLLTLCAQCSEMPSDMQDDYAWAEDRALLKENYVSGLGFYHQERAGYFGNEPMVLLGVPQAEVRGNGGCFTVDTAFVVSANSLYKEEIWQFIKFALNESNQMAAARNYSLPVNRKAMQAYFDKEIASTTGVEVYYSMNNEPMDFGLPTKQEAEELTAAVEGIQISTFRNEKLSNIISEEAGMFFAGDTTAETAAKNIQSRIGLYLAEQNG